MRARAAALVLLCEPALTLGCGGAVAPPAGTSDASADAPSSIDGGTIIMPVEAGPDSGPAFSGSGTCTLVMNDAAGEGGVLDGGGTAWPGAATWQTIGLVEDLTGVEVRCATTHEELRITIARGQSDGVATLQTYWGLEGTGTGKSMCTVQLSAAPWLANTAGVIGLFTCAPMNMSWGGRVGVSGTISAK
jgi:hypothetical protein